MTCPLHVLCYCPGREMPPTASPTPGIGKGQCCAPPGVAVVALRLKCPGIPVGPTVLWASLWLRKGSWRKVMALSTPGGPASLLLLLLLLLLLPAAEAAVTVLGWAGRQAWPLCPARCSARLLPHHPHPPPRATCAPGCRLTLPLAALACPPLRPCCAAGPLFPYPRNK